MAVGKELVGASQADDTSAYDDELHCCLQRMGTGLVAIRFIGTSRPLID